MRILLADDNPNVRQGLRKLLLHHSGMTVCGEAGDGIEAVEMASQLLPDVVLMDVTMPRMDGLQATRAIRRALPAVKVILVSQSDPAIVRLQAAEVQADGCVPKSDLPRDLLPVIERLCADPGAPPAWMTGGGEMGALMRGTNWTATSLGPSDAWSPALRMMVKFLLANRFPQLLWWGPQFCSLYNDAYVPILGAKHPWAIGRPVSEVWREIWDVLKPLIETPYYGGPATWMEDIPLEINRRGFMEETHFTIAYSPVPDETVPGGIGGVLATVHEITEKVVAERRVMVLRDLGLRSVEPKSAEEDCAAVAGILSRHPKDIPFLLLYLLNARRDAAHLVGGAGIDFADRGCPQAIDLALNAPAPVWPFPAVVAGGQIQLVRDLEEIFGRVPPGHWSDPPDAAAVVPIRSNVPHQLAGFLVAGISSRLQFDESYRNFLELVSTRIATTVANARAYEEERRRAEALAEIDRAKTAFFSNISHEFRTPLALMLGPLADLLARGETETLLAPAAREQLELVNRNGARLLRLVNTLLDFSRIEAGRVEALYQATDLAVFTSDLASAFRSATERAGLRLEVDCRDLGQPAYVDRDMWEKIVLNLLSNAFKFTFEGEIGVTLSLLDGAAELRVRDTGVGIPPEEMPRLFERFHRVPNTRSRTFEGSGIGLALVQELVKLHGGALRVESAIGRGSTFIVTIPLGQEHLPPVRVGGPRALSSPAVGAKPYIEEALRWLPEAQPLPQDFLPQEELLPVPSPPVAAAAASRPYVIVADDNADMRLYLLRLLGERYHAEGAPDGRAALDLARRRAPDLVLSDIMMPELDGLGLLRELRGDPALREIPIVLLSARAGEESRLEGIEAGADDYLVKPFSSRELMARVEAHIKMHRMRQHAEENYRDLAERLEAEVLLRTAQLRKRNAEVLQQSQLLREFSQRLMHVQDEERRRIARELHDSSGQILSALSMTLGAMSDQARAADGSYAADFDQCLGLVQQLSQEIRTLSYLLHPPLLDETGIAGALEWYVDGFNERSGIAVRLEIAGGFGRMASEVEMAVFRIVQEALTNIHRHSGSKQGLIRVLRSAGEVSVEIHDQGKGISPEKLEEFRSGGAGVGLRGMRERVHQLRGRISVDSDASGTRISVALPLAAPAAPPSPDLRDAASAAN